MHTLSLILATSFALLFLAPPALARPQLPPSEWQTKTDEIMAGKQGQEEITAFVGKEPDQCLASNSSDQLCEWNLAKKHAAWRPLADALDTRERISLICRIPGKSSDSLKHACSARPQSSNRGMFSPIQFKRDVDRKLKKEKKRRVNDFDRPHMTNKAIRAQLRPIAMSWLNAARNLEELSRLIGALPDRCKPASDGQQTCIWRTSVRTYGHGTVAASTSVSGNKKVDLICTLPLDGSFRRSGESCEHRPES